METFGVSPKVLYPLVVNVLLGGVLVALGERELGVGLLLAAATGAGFGYVASPGIVVPKAVDEVGLFGIVPAGDAELLEVEGGLAEADPED